MSGPYVELPVTTAEAVIVVADDDVRDLIIAVTGAIIFNVGANALQFFDGVNWQTVGTI